MRRWSAILAVSIAITVTREAAGKRDTRARAIEQKVFDAAVVNDSNTAKSNSQATTLRAQILLDRANVSPGEIDGLTGANFDRALAGFHELRSLPATGKLDDVTWQALNADTSAVITTYRIMESDVAGPFVYVPKDLSEQS